MQPLPIDPILPDLCAALRAHPSVVLEAPPGAGKTTRVPRALLDAGFAERGEILVLEPRRLAARLSARRVAEELGERVGETVGYTMRFEEAAGPATRIRFVTEGVLTRRLLVDRELRGVSAVVLDEFHERHLAGDVALALLRRLQRGARPDLRLVVMSATLDAGPIAAFLGAREAQPTSAADAGGAPTAEAPRCATLRAEGRMFDVAIEHLEPARVSASTRAAGDRRAPAHWGDRTLESLVASSVRQLLDEGLDGDVLVFLPGSAEIRRSTEACAPLAKSADLLLLPLHGSLSPAEQDRAVRPADRRKVILSTNVAETSVTIDGVVAVVDSGLARVAAHAPWSGLPTLRVAPIARASAAQRAGRAGRTRPGRCLRLYTRGDFAARPEHEAPEIRRLDLAETVLELCAAGVTDLEGFGWLEAPPAAGLAAAEALLVRLGALDEGRRVTPIGRRMLRFPAHPRQARMIVEAERRGIAEDGCTLAAVAAERDLGAPQGPRAAHARHSSDLLAALQTFDEADRARFAADRLRWLGVDPARALAVERTRKQLARLADHRGAAPPETAEEREIAQRIAILSGYPDRVGRLRRPANASGRSGREVVLAAGGTAALSEASVIDEVDLVVAVDIEERSEGRSARTVVRSASAIEADWLLDLFTDAIRDTTEATWNAAAERVEVVRRLSYDGLVLDESRPAASAVGPLAEAAARELAAQAKAKGWRAFVKGDALEGWLLRVAFVRAHCPDAGLPDVGEDAVLAALEALCEGRRSFAELRDADLAAAVRASLSPAQARALAELAPESIVLPGGRRARLEYAADAPPSLASRLQDFFGMAEGPRVAGGRVPVVLHLCAPNQRPVQVTTDLSGFWARHYPAIAKELRRRYPKHAWPDDPARAAPPSRAPLRKG
ncbi:MULTISPECIES: ATP-dependent RNA helicase [Sorangium]|uniref:ATP-dependent helicase n=2 Tax=Sorangium cellulosum TaxID=56 RepID=A0A4P2QJS1_SORCE|nr:MULTISPECIES: ATP-dependent helicase C-terminal domain-containing protein [Sorangium]AUX30160.1 ATP-dependent helicase [Sorangium cellulosum]WCQ89551.1 ATP-dependent RNA helicase HrpB [Sorangium sp. Soce836]